MDLKCLLAEIRKGCLHSALLKLRANHANVNNESVLKILNVCSYVCCNRTKQQIVLCNDYLKELVLLLIHALNKPSDDHLLKYLNSVFFIVQYFINEKYYEVLPDLIEIVAPSYLQLKNNLIANYTNLSKLCYKAALELLTQDDEQSRSYLLAYINIYLQMTKLIDKPTLPKRYLECLNVLIANGVHGKHLVSYYFMIMEQACHFIDDQEGFIVFFVTLYRHLINSKQYSDAHVSLTLFRHLLSKTNVVLLDCIDCIARKCIPDGPTDCYIERGNFEHLETVDSHLARLFYDITLSLKNCDTYWERTTPTSETAVFVQILVLARNCQMTEISSTMYLMTGLLSLSLNYNFKNRICIQNNLLIVEVVQVASCVLLYMKANNMTQLEMCWNRFGKFLYNLMVTSDNNNDGFSVIWATILVKLSLILHPVEKDTVRYGFQYINQYYNYIKNYEKSLNSVAWEIIIDITSNDYQIKDDSVRPCWKAWVAAKAACRQEEAIKCQTIQNVLANPAGEKNIYCNSIRLPNNMLSILLLHELHVYWKLWKSKQPMLITFERLCANTNDVDTLVNIALKIWVEDQTEFHADAISIIKKLIESYGRSNSASMIQTAFLNYWAYKASIKAYKIHITEQNTGMLPMYLESRQYLEKVLSCILHAKDAEYMRESQRLLPLLIDMAYEYRIHQNAVQERKVSDLILKCCRVPNKKELLIKGLTVVMENSTPTSYPLLMKLVPQVERITNLKNNFQDIVICLWVGISIFYLHHDFSVTKMFMDRATRTHQECQERNKEHSAAHLYIRAKLLFAQFQIAVLPCHMVKNEHKQGSIVNIHKAMRCMIDHYNTNAAKLTIASLALLLDINSNLVKLYNDLHMPREARSFSKDTINVCTKLGLIIRHADFLLERAYAYLLCCNYKDYAETLETLENILCESENICQKYKSNCFKGSTSTLLTIAAIFNPTALAGTVSTKTIRKTRKAPKKNAVQPPECDCPGCSCFEYWKCRIRKLMLDVLHCIARKNLKQASELLSSSFEMFRYVKQKFNINICCASSSTCFKTFDCVLQNMVDFLICTNNKDQLSVLWNELQLYCHDNCAKTLYQNVIVKTFSGLQLVFDKKVSSLDGYGFNETEKLNKFY